MIFRACRQKKSGIVLIVVLAALALMSILLLALLRGSAHQVRGAETDAALAREKMLADSAVALVIGQIRQASTQTGQAWISQPGLLRTYDATATRKPTACYKLYSTSRPIEMTDHSGSLQFFADDVPADWNTRPNAYVDLNAPASTPGFFGRSIYPILDPAAKFVPTANGAQGIQGVAIDGNHGVEMPVAWLYQLQDGTLGPANLGTKANPIVARIAFWTDDETCKININTAGYGAAWNTPHVYSADDVTWSARQPATGEFSSYPGHPGMTSLAPVFCLGSITLSPQQILGLTPRYGFGGSQLGTQPTTASDIIPPKSDRLYASVDELCFGPGLNSSGQRPANPLRTDQIEMARFVLTAHSEAPETTLLGEPRVAIWPVSDAPQDSTRTTPADLAIESAATLNDRKYFFQRQDPFNPQDDFGSASSNLQLFNELVTRGSHALPGYDPQTTFVQKYPGAKWPQIMLEIADFIRGLNAIDPTPAPFIPFAAKDSSGKGRAFVVPLTLPSGAGTNLRGFGRCPTLSSLTLVFYVSGFELDIKDKDGHPIHIDYDETPDNQSGDSWKANFDPASAQNVWSHVTAERVRAFVVPGTFQPGCGYPEVNDACDIEIVGLDRISVNNLSNPFGFAPDSHSHFLNEALNVPNAERMWGGNEGPLAWRAAAQDAISQVSNGTGVPYAFAGTQPLSVPTKVTMDAAKHLTWSFTSSINPRPAFVFNAVTGLTIRIRDKNGNTLQTLTVDLPGFMLSTPPTINGECDHMDGWNPGGSRTDWATSDATKVFPSYYMCLQNRLLATQRSRPFLIQAGDVSRSVEAATDLRVIAGLSTVPSTLFHPHPAYTTQNPHAHNLRFADGTGVYGTSGYNQPTIAAYPSSTQSATGTSYADERSPVPLSCITSPACSVPTTAAASAFITMTPLRSSSPPPLLLGDWDTGPGFEPDGALINLPDAGTTLDPTTAYFSLSGAPGSNDAATRRTPNALVPSPVIFGSLPVGIDPAQPDQSQPWRTLLFCPIPAAGLGTAHPGAATPPDYLLLDNFWMPVVEPYPISTCITTAGKINLNDQIAPFTWLHRNTALHALLHDLRIPTISTAQASAYKTIALDPITQNPKPPLSTIWKTVDEEATLARLESRFTAGSSDAYLTEGEICTVPLVPENVASDDNSLNAFWNGASSAGHLTGDNLRELPYAQLYGRLTTRSNSYTVHVHVQVLQKLRGDPHQDVWNEGTDIIQGDWRGSYEIERYLDPASGHYHFRIVSSRWFAP